MKKILIYAFVLVFISSFAFVALYSVVYGANTNQIKSVSEATGNSDGQGVQTQSAGEETQTQVQTQQQTQDGEGEMIMAQEMEQIRARTSTELKEMIQEKRQAMKLELDEMKEERKEVCQNQNEVMLTVHALLASEELVGGIGPQVSEIAREFNNSVQATLLAEEKINSRSKFVKLFMGGDEKAADEIEQEVNSNRERVKTLNQLMTQCEECDGEVRNMIQEQIMNTEQEQNRLSELADGEKTKKGLFGWIKNIFRFGR